ncbi:MAG: JAB domain-containing protein [Sphingobacterium sp.]
MKLLTQFSSTMNINEVKVSYNKEYYQNGFVVNSSQKAYTALKEIYDMETIELFESFYVLFVDASARIVGYYLLSRGGTDFVPVDVKLIYMLALKTSCTAIILSHNHPSGTLRPSNADKGLTEKVIKAGMLLDIKVHDHIIITKESYYSFRDEGLI